MTPPYYTAVVANTSRGWSYSAQQTPAAQVTKLTPAQIAALPAVALADGLTVSWGFVGAQVPGPMDPLTATVRLAAKTAADMPQVERGDLLTIDLRVGTAGSRIVQPAPMRVSSVDAVLTDNKVYGAVMTVQLVERRSELQNLICLQGATNVNTNSLNVAHWRWRPRLAELALQANWSLACPGWWNDAEDVRLLGYTGGAAGNQFTGLEDPPRVATGVYGGTGGTTQFFLWDRSAYKAIDELLATHFPGFWTHTAYSGVGAYPSGWGKVAPVSNWGLFTSNPTDTSTAVADPATTQKVFLMPASRLSDGSAGGLPLVFSVRSGVLTLAPQYVNQSPTVPQSGHARVALDAAWCDLPATVRKSRDGAINQLNLKGQEAYASAAGAATSRRSTVRTYAASAAVQAADGLVAREVDTQLDFGTAGDSYQASNARFYSQEAPIVIAPQLLTDDSARQSWVYDQFTLVASRIPADLASSVLSRIAPRAPTEADSDSHVLRHLTLYRPAASVRAAAGLIGGFIAKGQLEVKGGDVVFTLTLTPGSPVWLNAQPAPVTVAQVDAASYQAQPCSTLDPLIRVADLANVAA